MPLTGGAIATVFDNVLGYQVIRAIGLNQSTLQLNVSYRRFIPLCTTVRMTCQVDRQEGRKSWVSAKVCGGVCAPRCSGRWLTRPRRRRSVARADHQPGRLRGARHVHGAVLPRPGARHHL